LSLFSSVSAASIQLLLPIMAPPIVEVDVRDLRWSHDKIYDHFKDHRSIYEMVVQLLLGEVCIEDLPPLEVALIDENFYSLSNRRLYALRKYQEILVKMGRDSTVKARAHMRSNPPGFPFTTQTQGETVELTTPTSVHFPSHRRGPRSLSPEHRRSLSRPRSMTPGTQNDNTEPRPAPVPPEGQPHADPGPEDTAMGGLTGSRMSGQSSEPAAGERCPQPRHSVQPAYDRNRSFFDIMSADYVGGRSCAGQATLNRETFGEAAVLQHSQSGGLSRGRRPGWRSCGTQAALNRETFGEAAVWQHSQCGVLSRGRRY